MSFTKVKIFNLAMSALKLSREITDTESDRTTTEVKVLNLHWDDAVTSTLQEMDLDSLSETIDLELVAELTDNGPWSYAYKYPSRCAFFRRIESGAQLDSRSTHIAKKVGLYEGNKVIFTNEYQARAEIIPSNVSLAALSSPAGFAIAHKLAYLSCPLLTGKGAKALQEEIRNMMLFFINEAQEMDKRENFNYDDESARSEFVAARLG